MTAAQVLLDGLPLLVVMLLLLLLSALFSASEAALFSLRLADRAALRKGTRSQQLADQLLDDPDRLLSGVLFWNLVVNMAYFALASQVGLRLREQWQLGGGWLLIYTGGSLLAIIFFSEMVPKSVAVLNPRRVSVWLCTPLALALRAIDPVMPALRLINLLSRRLIWPSFQSESYLQAEDLERAIELSTDDANLIDRERRVLHNLISLSELRVDECMRPRSQLNMYRPPLHWQNLVSELPADGYVFVTEQGNDEIVAALDLNRMTDFSGERLDYYAASVDYVPWCAKVADVFQIMETRELETVAVVNERGETIGALIRKDILDVVFTQRTSRSERLLNRLPIRSLGDGAWQVTGMSNLRILGDHFELPLPNTGSVTVAGVVQECLQRLPVVGDRLEWGPFEMEVTECLEHQPIVVRLGLLNDDEERS